VTRIRRSEGHRWRLGAKACGDDDDDDYHDIATENHLEKNTPYATVTVKGRRALIDIGQWKDRSPVSDVVSNLGLAQVPPQFDAKISKCT
jgi:hypothetical protein